MPEFIADVAAEAELPAARARRALRRLGSGLRPALALGLAALTACGPDRNTAVSDGQLRITTDPAGAEIFCDRQMAQTPAPLTLNLPAGEHLLVARKAGFLETRLTVTLQPGERCNRDLKLEPIMGLVLIHSKPSGAEVEVDNSHYGKTPVLIPYFPLGRHRLKLSAPNCMPKIVDVAVADRTPQLININLATDTARVLFESTPAGAQVTLNGTAIGNTPCEAPRLTSGKHRLVIALKGHVTFQDELTVQAGEEREIKVNLTALPGKLSVVSTPPKARLYINDQYKAETPLLTNALPAGTYNLRVELTGYASQTRATKIAIGEEAVEEFQLVKDSGVLLLSTEPAGVTVFLDGENRGATPALGAEPISAQLTIDLIPKGTHKVQLTKSGYIDQTFSVDILNQTLILHKKMVLRPVRFAPNVIIRIGSGAENTFRGVIRERYDNGDINVEIEPGVFKTFKASEIQAIEPIKNP
jgi:hypothetical protein